MLDGDTTSYSIMPNRQLISEELTRSVIGAFYEVYNTLGYGFYERFYAKALEIELGLRGHKVAREVRFPVMYKGHLLGKQRVDMVVDDKLIIESKATQELHRGAPRQLFSYLHGSHFELGFVFHFGPDARFYTVACRNSEVPMNANEPPGKGQTPYLLGNGPFHRGSDPSILESLNPSRLYALVRSWWACWRQQTQLPDRGARSSSPFGASSTAYDEG